MAWGDRGEQHNPSEPSEFAKRIKQDWYFKGGGVVPAEGANDQPLPQRVIRVRLTEPLYGCQSAKAIHLINTPDESDIESETLTVYDPINTVANALIAVEDNGELYIPAGTCCYAVFVYDSGGIWCAMEYGVCCQGSGSGSEGSGSEGSGSEGSGSEGSGSGISGDRCWIGENVDGLPWHKRPNRVDAPFATCGISHTVTNYCGLYIDDAGHVIATSGDNLPGWHHEAENVDVVNGSKTVTHSGGGNFSNLSAYTHWYMEGPSGALYKAGSISASTIFDLVDNWPGASATIAVTLWAISWVSPWGFDPPPPP